MYAVAVEAQTYLLFLVFQAQFMFGAAAVEPQTHLLL